jgi:UDP-N-acetylglucosamine 2-epimerase
MKRILIIIGALPQFIKASVVFCVIQKTDGIEEAILRTD